MNFLYLKKEENISKSIIVKDKYTLIKAHRNCFGKEGIMANRLGIFIKSDLLEEQKLLKIEKPKTSMCSEKHIPFYNAQFICEQKINITTKTYIMFFLKISKNKKEYSFCFVTTHLHFKNNKLNQLQGFQERINELTEIYKCYEKFKNKLKIGDCELFIMGDLNFRCNFNYIYFNNFFEKKYFQISNNINQNMQKTFYKLLFLKGNFLFEKNEEYYKSLKNQIKKIINGIKNKNNINELKKYDELSVYFKLISILKHNFFDKINENKLNIERIDFIKDFINYKKKKEINKISTLLVDEFNFMNFFADFKEGIDNKGPYFTPTCILSK